MGNGTTVSTDVTPQFNETIERIGEDRDDQNKSETLRHLLREGAKQYDEQSFAQVAFKNLAIALALVALVGYLWAALIAGYDRPLYFGVVWMVPAVACLWLYELWPTISARFGRSSGESVNPSEV